MTEHEHLEDEYVFSGGFRGVTLKEKLHPLSRSQIIRSLAAPSILNEDILSIGSVDTASQACLRKVYHALRVKQEISIQRTRELHATLVALRRGFTFDDPFHDSAYFSDLHTHEAFLATLFQAEYVTKQFAQKMYRYDSGEVRDLARSVHKGELPPAEQFLMDVWLYRDAFDMFAEEKKGFSYLGATNVRFKSEEGALHKAMRTMAETAEREFPQRDPRTLHRMEKLQVFSQTQLNDANGIGFFHVIEGEQATAPAKGLLEQLRHNDRITSMYNIVREKDRYSDNRTEVNDYRVVLEPKEPPFNRIEVYISDYHSLGTLEIGPRRHSIFNIIRNLGTREESGNYINYGQFDAIIKYVGTRFSFPR